MTTDAREQIERDVLYEAEKTARNYKLHRIQLAAIADKLEELINALRAAPETVTPLPEMDAPDYREAINLLDCQKIIALCEQARELQRRHKLASERKSSLGF